jgi:chemotaxis protein MotB
MAERLRPIIVVKKIKKHAGHHGGQWKVAYADFVTAMMAFFLLLWLLSMVSPDRRAALSQYFKEFNVFKEQGETFTKGGAGILEQKGLGRASDTVPGRKEAMSPEKLKTKIRAAVDVKLKTLKDQVLVDIHEGAVRIQIVDNEGSQMFLLGSAKPTDKALEILSLVSETIKETPNKIVVEGHTDALPYKGGEMTNWELSTARASAARRVLENDGITPDRIAKVTGYADNDLLIKLYPNDPRNRRISIILLPIQYTNTAESFNVQK